MSYDTPFQKISGRWYKREDLYRVGRVNGSKLRSCEQLLTLARERGYERVVTACSVLSPQSAIVSTLCARLGLPLTIIYGGTRPSTAFRHPSPALARDNGASFEFIPVGYNPALQSAARSLTATDMGAYLLHYGITTPPDASVDDLVAFHRPVADQVAKIPPDIRTMVIPFGSANTATGVVMGLIEHRHQDVHLVLVGIGPDRRAWMAARLDRMGMTWDDYTFIDLHGTGRYRYSDRVDRVQNGILLHPTYEAKVVAALDADRPSWWTDRDSTTCLWIVGGPII